ncbi:trigger factor [Lentibacillus sp. CBA3610]|uniref:trigger factor n=1 Tax=Lentibacillus sp. CBA3610 TaxID=2518176 RepID=UPI00350E40B4
MSKIGKKQENQGLLTFVIADEFDKALDQAFKKVVKDVPNQAFRKGKFRVKFF